MEKKIYRVTRTSQNLIKGSVNSSSAKSRCEISSVAKGPQCEMEFFGSVKSASPDLKKGESQIFVKNRHLL
jgi:hypothetical protein